MSIIKAIAQKIPYTRRYFGLSNYEETFVRYIQVGYDKLTRAEKHILMMENIPYGDPRVTGFRLPGFWQQRVWETIAEKSELYNHVKIRTTQNDRLIVPTLGDSNVGVDAKTSKRLARFESSIEKYASEDDKREIKGMMGVEDDFEVVYSQKSIDLKSFSCNYSLTKHDAKYLPSIIKDIIIENTAQGIINEIERLVFESHVNTYPSIFNTLDCTDPSEGIKSVSGYLPVTNIRNHKEFIHAIKGMLFHLPQGYRKNAKYYMNRTTADMVGGLNENNVYLDENRYENFKNREPMKRLLGKPVIINNLMQDYITEDFPIVLADLSRGYHLARRNEIHIKRSVPEKSVLFKDSGVFGVECLWNMGGSMIQPAAVKFLRIIDDFDMPENGEGDPTPINKPDISYV